MHADELIANVREWSARDRRVIAAAVCGSYARGDARPDSDVDFCIVARERGPLLDDRSWIHGLGADVRVSDAVEDYRLVQSIRAYFGSLEVEFGVTDATWAQVPLDRETAAVINDGLRVLYDPEGRLAAAAAFAARMFP